MEFLQHLKIVNRRQYLPQYSTTGFKETIEGGIDISYTGIFTLIWRNMHTQLTDRHGCFMSKHSDPKVLIDPLVLSTSGLHLMHTENTPLKISKGRHRWLTLTTSHYWICMKLKENITYLFHLEPLFHLALAGQGIQPQQTQAGNCGEVHDTCSHLHTPQQPPSHFLPNCWDAWPIAKVAGKFGEDFTLR